MERSPLILVKAWVILALIPFIPLLANAGMEEIDSLRELVAIQTHSREKADNLNTIGKAFYNANDLDSAMLFGEKAMMVSLRLEYTEGISDAHYLQSIVHEKQSELDAAIASARESLSSARESEDQTRIARGYFQYGKLLQLIGETDSASYFLHKCLATNVVIKDSSKIMPVANMLGNLYQDISEFDSAAHYYLYTIKIAEATGNIRHLAKLYNNLGKTFTRMEEFDEGRKYLEMALELNKNNNDDYTTALILMNLGSNYLEQEKTDMALVYYDQAADIYKKFGDIIDIYDLYNNYAEVYELKGKYDLALDYINKAVEGYARKNYAEGLSIVLKNKGDIYTKLGRYDLARLALDSSMNVARRGGYQKNQLDILTAMSTNYEKAGDFRNAYEHESKRFDLFREVFDLEKDKTVNNLKLRYEKEKDQAEILALKNMNLEMELDLRKKTNQRNGYLFTGLGIIVIGLFIFLYLRQRVTIARQKIVQLEEEKKLMAAQLLVEGQEQERKRIARELHDGLGVLLSATRMQFTSIKDVSPENQPLLEKASQLLEQATGDVRKISHNMMPGLLTRMGFFEAVEDFMEDLNDSDQIATRCEIIGEHQERLPENKEIMLYRIVQEMVNNTLKHAKANNIELKIKVFPGQLQIKYMDDGRGFDAEKVLASETGSLGLKSIQSRVSFLNGEMDLQSKPGEGVIYTIQVPV